MSTNETPQKLKLLPLDQYTGIDREHDPLRFYYWPIIGNLYKRRVELCLAECSGGDRILEIGFGSGVTFLNLHEKYKEIHGAELSTSINDVKTFFHSILIDTYLINSNVLNLPYADNHFDTVLLISILEHLKSETQIQAFLEISRVLKPGGQVVYGVPIERPLMSFLFRIMGYNIHDHHFSTEDEIFTTAKLVLKEVRLVRMRTLFPFIGDIYHIGHFLKAVDTKNILLTHV
jgi:ubiquinone/menaquinone biosynthesis C-methylase UbiE